MFSPDSGTLAQWGGCISPGSFKDVKKKTKHSSNLDFDYSDIGLEVHFSAVLSCAAIENILANSDSYLRRGNIEWKPSNYKIYTLIFELHVWSFHMGCIHV